jgi:hypothetical protein
MGQQAGVTNRLSWRRRLYPDRLSFCGPLKQSQRDGHQPSGSNVITLEDCIAFCGLTEEEVLAIAEHEHLPEIAATALAEYLLSQHHGSEKVRDMIVDDVRQAQLRGDREHVLTLLHVLHHFLKTHPEAAPPHHPWSERF